VTRVLLDTNVVLDFLLDRAPFADAAAALWQANDVFSPESLLMQLAQG
jgi:predicted nucleic acid-binding protein